ncbi:hypothetical protein DFH11DRAFT_32284 [Phellopilus nigrolimitatus]|nr:hypothetical protein DFH11DRAFT_32284 [Phellopilus nigrolimitatus]
MEDTAGSGLAASSEQDASALSVEAAPPSPALPPALGSSTYVDNNDSMTTVPDGGDEVWSDAQEVAGIEDAADAPGQEIDEVDEDSDGRTSRASIRVAASALSTDAVGEKISHAEGKRPSEAIMSASIENSSSSMAGLEDSQTYVQVTAPSPPSVGLNSTPSSPTASTTQSASILVPSSSVSIRGASPTPSPTPASQFGSVLDHRQSRRSTFDNRATNRFSGFLTNLIHRRPERDHFLNSSAVREERDPPLTARGEESSRASSPIPPSRSVTPPPSLPPPSLQELGLCLTSLTSILTPSHFSAPPASGTFLGPHYLLLCHTQGLDVLPLVSPPAPQPYALVRRVSFKSVVVMEEKGVLVAIAGRRDGVRVYALEEVKKAVAWRVDVEIRREKERSKREETRKGTAGGVNKVFGDLASSSSFENERRSKAKKLVDSPTTPTPATPKIRRRKSSIGPSDSSVSPRPRPRAATIARKSRTPPPPRETRPAQDDSDPPPYQSPTSSRPNLQNRTSVISIAQTRSRTGSVSNVMAGNSARRRSAAATPRDDEKGDWEHYSSDDEAINMASAGSSGSAALDERTSTMVGRNASSATPSLAAEASQPPAALDVPNMTESLRRSQTASTIVPTGRRNRPAQLDLSLSRTSTATGNVSRPPPSPTPSVWTLRDVLAAIPPVEGRSRTNASDVDGEDDDDDGGDAAPISFAQALMESRLPDLPPPGSQQPQEPIFIGSHQAVTEPQSPGETVSDVHTAETAGSQRTSGRSRRRWSVLDGVFTQSGSIESMRSFSRPSTPSTRPRTPGGSSMSERTSNALTRIVSSDVTSLQRITSRGHLPGRPSTASSAPVPIPITPPSAPSTPSHRFLPRIITKALHGRRTDDQGSPGAKSTLSEKPTGSSVPPLPPAPKLEYVKLPGTKGAVMIKAVETAKKSFLAILCGENGEKVELFAGTYKTTLGLSRTFILPDSPRSLELQLQGDDLVEVFLVFSQNVFGLEPATVRVREVRVGRAERRAARRRARGTRVEELISSEMNAPSLGDGEATDVSLSVGLTLTASATSQTFDESSLTTPPMSRQVSDPNMNASESTHQPTPPNTSQSEELSALATAQVAPYTTFQQLSFAPQFPLATIADECIIPPTYQSFLEYRAQYEPEPDGVNNLDLANVQFSPPGLPVPAILPPSRWFYRDPKGTVQGPWKASLMQTWYKDGLLPPDLPVRREEDLDYVLLKDLRAQSVDPSHPFRSPPPPLNNFNLPHEQVKPLLEPISLLTQSRRYGPPALFYTTRGGHSTSIVDARGRSILRGRLQWSADDDENFAYGSRLGDVKRLETFDVENRAVIAAVRQGGLEVTEIADALMVPGDLSRPLLPNFKPHPSSVSRRNPFVWKVGSPLSAFAAGPVSSTTLLDLQTPVSKKQVLGTGKSPAKSEFALGNADDYEGRQHDELLFLGRVGENVYFCERSNGSFRILRLCPNTSS